MARRGESRKEILDFIVIGAGKSGTTSLHEYLRTHPAVHVPADKEQPFFDQDVSVANGLAWFLDQEFGDAPIDRLWGKVTPQYLEGAPVPGSRASDASEDIPPEWIIPRRIHTALPDAKLVAILRDPVDRCVSSYRMGRLRGEETRPFDEVVDLALQPEALELGRHDSWSLSGFVTGGEYARLLAPYRELFGDQLLIFLTDDLNRDPRGLLAALFEHLGIDATFVPPNLGTRYREASTKPRVMALRQQHLEAVLGSSGALRRLHAALPEGLRRRSSGYLRQVLYRIDLWNRTRETETIDVTSTAIAALRAHYRADTRRLAGLIGKDVPWEWVRSDAETSKGDAVTAVER